MSKVFRALALVLILAVSYLMFGPVERWVETTDNVEMTDNKETVQ